MGSRQTHAANQQSFARAAPLRQLVQDRRVERALPGRGCWRVNNVPPAGAVCNGARCLPSAGWGAGRSKMPSPVLFFCARVHHQTLVHRCGIPSFPSTSCTWQHSVYRLAQLETTIASSGQTRLDQAISRGWGLLTVQDCRAGLSIYAPSIGP